MRDVGEGKSDIGRIDERLRRRNKRLRHLRLLQHKSAEHAPFVGELAADAEINAPDAIGSAGGYARYRAGRTGGIGTIRCRGRAGGYVSRFPRVFFLGLE